MVRREDAGRIGRTGSRAHPGRRGRRALAAAVAAAVVASGLTAGQARADGGGAAWLANPTSGNWVPAAGEANWGTGANLFPGSTSGTTNADTATFNVASTTTSVALNSTTLNVKSVLFDTAATSYVIGADATPIYLTAGGSIAIASTLTATTAVEKFNAQLALLGDYSVLNNNTVGTSGNTLNIAGGAAAATSAATLLTLGGTNTNLNNLVSGALTDGTAGGVLSLAKTGPGVWDLTGANAYTGNTTIAAGTLVAGSNSALGTGAVSVATGSDLRLNNATITGKTITLAGTGNGSNGALSTVGAASGTWAGGVILGSNGTRLGTQGAGTLTINGVVDDGSNTFDLAVSAVAAGGTVVLGNVNTYGGKTQVVRGTLKIGVDNALPTGTTLDVHALATTDPSTFDLNGFNQTVGGLTRSDTTGAGTVTNSSATAATFTVSSAAAFTFSGQVRGAALNFAKDGTGTLVLSGANDYGGTTTVAGGTLQIGAGAAAGTLGAGQVTDNATLAFARSDAVTIANNIGGTGGVVQAGPGTLTLSGTNTYAGGTTINGGVLAFGSAAALPSAGLVTVNAAGGLAATGAFPTVGGLLASGRVAPASTGAVVLTANSSEAINLAGYPTLMLGATGAVTYSGALTPADGSTYLLGGGNGTLTFPSPIGGASSLVVGATGSAGTVVLASPNTYSGTTTINGGVLNVQNGGALGSAAAGTVVNTNAAGVGGALQLQGGVTLAEPITLNGGGDATGSGALRSLSGNNTLAGPLTIGNVTNNNRLVSDAGLLTISGNVSIPTAGRVLVLQGAGSGLISGVISGAGSLTKSTTGGGTWTLAAANTYTGPTTISGGVLALAAANALPAATTVAGGGGVLDLGGFNQQVAGLAGTTGLVIANSSTTADAVLAVDTTAASATFAGSLRDVTGAGTRKVSLVKLGANTQTLTNANTFSGGLTILGGTASEDFGTLPAATASGNQTLANNLSAAQALTLGGGTFNVTGRANGTLTALAGTSFASGATVITVTSTTNLAPGQAITGAGIPAGAYVASVTSGTQFVLSAATTAANSGSYAATANTATSTQTFAGLTLLPGASAVTSAANPTTALNLNAIGRPAGATVNFAPGTNSAFTTTTANASSAGGQQTILGGYATFGGTTWAVSGSGATAGTISGLPAASFYSADFGAGAAGKDVDVPAAAATATVPGMTVNSVRFATSAAYNLTLSGPLVVAAGGLLATNATTGGVTINGSAANTITSGNGTDLVVTTNSTTNFFLGAPVVDADGGATPIGLTKGGSGQYVVSTGASTYTGPTYLNSGVTIPQSSSSGPAGSPTNGPFGRGTLVFNGGSIRATTSMTGVTLLGNPVTFRADTSFVTAGSADKAIALTGPMTLVNPAAAFTGTPTGGTRTITVTSAADAILAGAVGDGGLGVGLIKAGTGAGRLVLTGANTYTGGTTISGGTLAGTTVGLQGNITDNATLVFDQTLPTLTGGAAIPFGTYAGVISGTGALTKSGAGTVSLTGTSTYTGATTITGGTLAVNGALTASSAVMVQSGGTVGGTGSIAGPLTVNSAGTLSPGSGTLSPGDGAGTLTVGTLTLAAGSTLLEEVTSGTAYDKVVAAGVNAAGGGANLQVALGSIPSAGDAYTILANGSAAATPTLFDNVVTPVGTFAFVDNGNGTYTATDTLGGTYTLNYAFNADGGAVGNDVLLTTTAVPEPAAAVGLGLAAFGLLARRRRAAGR